MYADLAGQDIFIGYDNDKTSVAETCYLVSLEKKRQVYPSWKTVRSLSLMVYIIL